MRKYHPWSGLFALLCFCGACSGDIPGIVENPVADTCAVYPDGFKNSVYWQWPQYPEYSYPCFNPADQSMLVCLYYDRMNDYRYIIRYTIGNPNVSMSLGEPASEHVHSLSWSMQGKVFTTQTPLSMTRINTVFGTTFSTEYPYYIETPMASPNGYYILSRKRDLDYANAMILIYDFNGIVIDTVDAPGADMYSWIDDASILVWNSITNAYKVVTFPAQQIKRQGTLPGNASYMHRKGLADVFVFCYNGSIYQYALGQDDRYYLLKSACGDVYSYINCSVSADGEKILAERHSYHPLEGLIPPTYIRRKTIVLMNADGSNESEIIY